MRGNVQLYKLDVAIVSFHQVLLHSLNCYRVFQTRVSFFPVKNKNYKKKKKKRNETINRHAIYPKVNLSSIFFSFVILRVFRDLDAKWNTLCTRSPSTFIFAKETFGSGQPSVKEAIEILGKLIGKRATPRF